MEKFVAANKLIFQAQTDDFDLKCCMEGANSKIRSSGRSPCFLGEDSPSGQIAKSAPKFNPSVILEGDDCGLKGCIND
jgi:hypothetical protein